MFDLLWVLCVMPLEHQGYITATTVTLAHYFQDVHHDCIIDIQTPMAKVDMNLISPFSDISLVVCCSSSYASQTTCIILKMATANRKLLLTL